jgi:predicted nuclease of predicted toxin-antitoxin system
VKAHWQIWHANEVGLQGRPDSEVFLWAQREKAIVLTYDEDFADARLFPLGQHYGIIRLRVWPTTVEETVRACERLFALVPHADIPGSLVIIDANRIRLRRPASGSQPE